MTATRFPILKVGFSVIFQKRSVATQIQIQNSVVFYSFPIPLNTDFRIALNVIEI